MQRSLRIFASNELSSSFYIYQKLLGHESDDIMFKSHIPKHLSAPNLPDLNISQVIIEFLNMIFVSNNYNFNHRCML